MNIRKLYIDIFASCIKIVLSKSDEDSEKTRYMCTEELMISGQQITIGRTSGETVQAPKE